MKISKKMRVAAVGACAAAAFAATAGNAFAEVNKIPTGHTGNWCIGYLHYPNYSYATIEIDAGTSTCYADVQAWNSATNTYTHLAHAEVSPGSVDTFGYYYHGGSTHFLLLSVEDGGGSADTGWQN